MFEHTSLTTVFNKNKGEYQLPLDQMYEAQRVPENNRIPRITVMHSIEDELPRAAMSLKQAIAVFGMHLSFAQRDRLYGELDYLIDVEGWDPDDAFPQDRSFSNFLRWVVDTRSHQWASLALDGDGSTVAAFVKDENVITAAFLPDATVHWTAKFVTADGLDISAGRSPLRTFAAQTPRLLERL